MVFSGQIHFNLIKVTFLMEMLELANLGNMTKSTIEFELRDKILLVMSKTKIITS